MSVFDGVDEQVDLIRRHLTVLQLVAAREPVGMTVLARDAGWTRPRVRYSIEELTAMGLVEPTREGTTTTPAAGAYVETHTDRLDAVAERLDRLPDAVEVGA